MKHVDGFWQFNSNEGALDWRVLAHCLNDIAGRSVPRLFYDRRNPHHTRTVRLWRSDISAGWPELCTVVKLRVPQSSVLEGWGFWFDPLFLNWDAVSSFENRTSATELSGRKVNYSYDNVYRLTSETIAGDPYAMNGAVSYSYDAVGNRLQKTSTLPGFAGASSTYNTNDELSTDQYDAEGNTVGSGANTGANGYVYDFENRLVQQGGISVVYDGDGNRVKSLPTS